MLIRPRPRSNNSRAITSTTDPSASTIRRPEITATPVPAADAAASVADVVDVVVEAEDSAVVVAVEDSVVVVEADVPGSVLVAVAAEEAAEGSTPSRERRLHSKQCTCGIGGFSGVFFV
jgi:hypothetical protein